MKRCRNDIVTYKLFKQFMLTLIENNIEKKRAQKAVEAELKASLKKIGVRNIGYPGGNTDQIVYAVGEGELYVAFGRPDANGATPRYWNAFGEFRNRASSQEITVEINIAVDGNPGRVAGFFAKDGHGDIYLMHTGRVGGGRKGIGRSAFLTWSMLKLIEVEDSRRGVRRGVVVARIGSGEIAGQIASFTSKVANFKRQVASGALEAPDFKARLDEFERYKPEFSGRKRGSRSDHFDYFTYHGDVVQALYNERAADCSAEEHVYSNRLIDLYVRKAGAVTEVYEVKACSGRQALYTAIGQLETHAAPYQAKKILVLPADEEIPDDVAAALLSLGITIRYFVLSRQGRRQVVKLVEPAS